MKRIYAIYDIIAEMILGDHLQTFRHDAAAIRFFSDVAKQEGTMVRQHTADFRLITIAELHDNAQEIEVVPNFRIILEGKQWLAMQENDITGGKAPDDVTISLAKSRE